jgi:hypothetical protein
MNDAENNDLGLRSTALLLQGEQELRWVASLTVARVGRVQEKGCGNFNQHGGDNDADCLQGEAVQGHNKGKHWLISRRAGSHFWQAVRLFGWLFWGTMNSGGRDRGSLNRARPVPSGGGLRQTPSSAPLRLRREFRPLRPARLRTLGRGELSCNRLGDLGGQCRFMRGNTRAGCA